MTKFDEGFLATMKELGCEGEAAKSELEAFRKVLADEIAEMEDDYDAGVDSANEAASYWD